MHLNCYTTKILCRQLILFGKHEGLMTVTCTKPAADTNYYKYVIIILISEIYSLRIMVIIYYRLLIIIINLSLAQIALNFTSFVTSTLNTKIMIILCQLTA